MDWRRGLTVAGLLIGAAALILQFVLTIPSYMANGVGLPVALVRFFSYYTILTNLVLVLIYLSALAGWSWLAWFRSQVTRAMMAGVMMLVMFFYHILLSGLWSPQGLFKLADVTLHYVTPLLYGLWWLTSGRSRTLTWAAVPLMLIPSLLYVIYVMIRGALVGEYPYPILEANTLGYGPVLVNILAVAVVLLVLFCLAVAIDTFLSRRKSA